MPENQTDTNLQKNLSVLIAGGSGLIGNHLTTSLLTAGYKVTHREFKHVLAKVMKLPVLPPVPGFLIRIALGEMSEVILKGSRISSEKIMNTGYSFQFKTLENALYNIIRE